MINNLIRRIFVFIAFVLIQGLILNHIVLFGCVTPYLYPLFILLLPFETPKWKMVLYGFCLGFCIDLFTGDLGFHAFSTMLMAFLRYPVIWIITNMKSLDKNQQPCIADMETGWFLKYSFFGMMIHQISLVYMETFQFHTFMRSALEVILNTFLAILIFILYQYIFIPKKS